MKRPTVSLATGMPALRALTRSPEGAEQRLGPDIGGHEHSGRPGDQHGKPQSQAHGAEHRADGDDQRGDRRAGDQQPVDQPDQQSDAKPTQHADPGRQVIMARQDRHRQRGGRQHRADRDVQLSRDHEEADRQRDDADLGRHVQKAGPAGRAEEGRAAKRREEDVDHEGAKKRARLGPAGQAAECAGCSAGRDGGVGHRDLRRMAEGSGPQSAAWPDGVWPVSACRALRPPSSIRCSSRRQCPGRSGFPGSGSTGRSSLSHSGSTRHRSPADSPAGRWRRPARRWRYWSGSLRRSSPRKGQWFRPGPPGRCPELRPPRQGSRW